MANLFCCQYPFVNVIVSSDPSRSSERLLLDRRSPFSSRSNLCFFPSACFVRMLTFIQLAKQSLPSKLTIISYLFSTLCHRCKSFSIAYEVRSIAGVERCPMNDNGSVIPHVAVHMFDLIGHGFRCSDADRVRVSWRSSTNKSFQEEFVIRIRCQVRHL